MTTEAEILNSTAALIPAFNAASRIGEVLDRVEKVIPADRIVVVDDGSTDETYGVATKRGVQVVQHPVNRGKGAALATGFRKATSMGMEYVVTLDADNQHDPAEIPNFVRRIAETGADIVVGNRSTAPGGMPWLRRATNWFTSRVVSGLAHCSIPDSQNGYRMIRLRAIEGIKFVTSRFETESELLVKAGRAGARIDSVPIQSIYGEEVSAIDPVVDTARFFRMVVRALFW